MITVCMFECVCVCRQARAARGVRGGGGGCQMEIARPTERLAIVWTSSASLLLTSVCHIVVSIIQHGA